MQCTDAPNPARQITAALFCLGVCSLLTQMLLLREVFVVFLGNELTIGLTFAVWLAAISLGALTARAVASRSGAHSSPALISTLLAVLAVIPSLQLLLLRGVRGALPMSPGEYGGPGLLLGTSLLVLLPYGFVHGLVFPLACQALAGAETQAHAVSRAYRMEALGSGAGGVAFTFVLVERMNAWQIVALSAAVAWSGVACLTPVKRSRAWALATALALLSVALFPRWTAPLEEATLALRWRGQGVGWHAAPGTGGPRLVASRETRYQNLALIASGDLFTLYGNGQVLFSFPDTAACETAVHFVMAQKPDARRVLLLGGNPLGEIPQLLRYPLEKLVYVEADPGIGRLLAETHGVEYRRLVADPRVRVEHHDPARFVKVCSQTFDVILLRVPEPTTTGLNRFWTEEFFRDVGRRLAADGLMHATLETSERLEQDAARLGGVVYHTLQRVFAVVWVTAGVPTQFFAGLSRCPVTFDRETLYHRWLAAGIAAEYFRADYFLAADEIAPEKVAVTEQRLAGAQSPVNTVWRPVAYYYNLMLWSRYTADWLRGVLERLARLRLPTALALVVLAGCVMVGLAAVWHGRPGPVVWTRGMIGSQMALAGLLGVALELALIYAFQSLYGYIYTRIGLMVGLFMLGSVLGSMLGGRWERAPVPSVVRGAVAMQTTLVCVAGGVAVAVRLAGEAAPPMVLTVIEVGLYLGMLVTATAVGALFCITNRLFRITGRLTGVAAAALAFADYGGSAVGGLLVGVGLLPVLGVGATALLLAALGITGWLCLGAAALSSGGFDGSWTGPRPIREKDWRPSRRPES